MRLRIAVFLILACAAVIAQRGVDPPNDPFGRPDIKLPSGKSQRDEIVRADHKRNQEDSVKLAVLTAELRDELAIGDSHVVSVKMLKKVEDIEKLARNIRGRLKRN